MISQTQKNARIFPAAHLYERLGVVTVRETEEEFVMVVRLPQQTNGR